MSIREALKADFGIEVRVNRGSGQRDDPFVIEPSTAAEAVRTQLDLLRGLSRGRRELWRLLTVEPAGDDTPAMQRVRVETIAFTPEEFITEVRAFYFDVSQVDGLPDAGAPLIVWTDPRTTFAAVSQIGWLHFDNAIDNSRDDTALNASLFYSAIGAKATIYVYSASDPTAKGLPPNQRRDRELHSVCSQVHAENGEADSPWPAQVAGPFVLKHFLIGDDLSVAGIAILGEHFLKLRMTCRDEPKMREVMRDTVEELACLVHKKGPGLNN